MRLAIPWLYAAGGAGTPAAAEERFRSEPLATPRSLTAHSKVALLGGILLLSCVVVAVIGVWGVASSRQSQLTLARREAPALALLLQTDRDLHQAQLGLERAAIATDPRTEFEAVQLFRNNVAESEKRFAAYQRIAVYVEEETLAVAAYERDRMKWLRAADELNRAASAGDAAPSRALPSPSVLELTKQTRMLFDAMRENVNHIVDEVYQPVIEASGDRADRNALFVCINLLLGVVVTVAAGMALTRKMAITLQTQERETESLNVERERFSRRQTFEARLSRGFDMAQDEEATLRIVEEAVLLAAPGVIAEVLLADSSRAHLHRAASIDGATPQRSCLVATPSDCPAARRVQRLTFESSSTFDACPHLKGRPGGACSAVCIPLSIMGQNVGVLHAMAPDWQPPPLEQVQALEQIASKVGEKLGLLRAFRRTEAQAACDPLTGLMNRRSLEEKVHELTRRQIPFAVAYGDLDHFKRLNDTRGHETGDKALRTFAQVLKTSIRPGDLPARWGGEEFVLILPHASSDEAVAVLDRVRKALATASQGSGMPVFTVSFGVAQTAEGSLFVDVLARADAALLHAKREGRNCTMAAGDAAATTPITPEPGGAN